MTARIDISGQRFGRLVAISRTANGGSWTCKCDCGNTCDVYISYLKSSHTRSCGCLKRETSRNGARSRFTHHGQSRTLLYRLWISIRHRCRTDKDYVGRVSVCDEWAQSLEAFSAWASANGWAQGLSLDRIDNSKGYSPENCRFVTPLEQARNKTNNKLTVDKVKEIKQQIGCTSQADLAARYGVSKYMIYAIKTGKAWADVHA